MRKNLVWLASYPKSGNTWLRFLLVNYLLDGKEPVPINEIGRYSVSDSGVRAFSQVAGRPANSLSPAEVMALRPAVQRLYAENPADLLFVKTHSMVAEIAGVSTIDPAVTWASLQVVRNPMDVAVSFANHYGCSLEKAVDSLCREGLVLRGNPKRNLYSLVGSWSANTRSWSAAKDLKVLTLRYEDMQEDMALELGRALTHIGLEPVAERVEKAVAYSRFDCLAAEEAQAGFPEAARSGGRFFRAGTVGDGARQLSRGLIRRLWETQEPMIRQQGYLQAFQDALGDSHG